KLSNIPREYIYPTFGMDSHGKDFKNVGVFGDKTYDGKSILLLGDSHALTFKPYLDTLGKEEEFSFKSITNDAYPAIPYLTDQDIVENFRMDIYEDLLPYIKSEVDSADILIVYFARDGKRWFKALEKLILNLKPSQKILFI